MLTNPETMPMRRFLFPLLALPLLVGSTLAQSALPSGGGRALEEHYFSVGLGVPMTSYPDDTRTLIENLESAEGVSRLPLEFNVGVYWPISDAHTLFGPILEVTSDHLSRGDESISFNLMTLAASARRYFTGVAGDGLFGRVDAGIAFAGVNHRYGGDTYSESGNIGFGGAAGAGWAFAVSSSTSIEIGATALFRALPGHETGQREEGADVFEQGSYVAGSFSVGVLW
jgi:hypothetical protein